MAGITTSITTNHLTRSNVWSEEIKEILRDDLQAQGLVRVLPDFEGTTLNIPSIGQLTVRDYTEESPIVYDSMDTGNYTFTINKYISSATYITEKARQDAYYASQLEAMFVPEQTRALEEYIESTIFAVASDSTRGGQTTANANSINGYNHRWVANGGSSGAWVLQPQDFARAKISFKKANVPLSNLVAFVDPENAYHLETSTNIVNVSNNPQWEGIITTGLTSGMRFVKNIYGFDVYETNYLQTTGVESIGGDATGAAGVANILFSADQAVNPFLFAWRMQPRVESEWDMDNRREKYITVCRFGVQIYRPENLICVLTDTGTVSF